MMQDKKQCPEDMCEQLCEHPQLVCIAQKESINDSEAQQVAEIFKLLGDTTRVKILQILSKRELCVCDIAAVVEMGQSAVSHQLRLLRNARLVRYRREGKYLRKTSYFFENTFFNTFQELGSSSPNFHIAAPAISYLVTKSVLYFRLSLFSNQTWCFMPFESV